MARLIPLSKEKGAVLPIVLMVLALLLSVAGGAMLMGQLDLRIMSNFKTGTEAFYIAEAGLWQAIQELGDNDGTNDFETVTLPQNPFLSNTTFGSGTYTVKLTEATALPRIINIESTGTAPNNATRVVKVKVEQYFAPGPRALVTNGNLAIAGNIKLMGKCGAAHSNSTMELQNSAAELPDGFTSSGTMTVSGTPCIGSDTCDDPSPDAKYVLGTTSERTAYADSHDGQPQKTLPTVKPGPFAQAVAGLGAPGYILHNDTTDSATRVTTGGTCAADTGLCTGGTAVDPLPSNFPFDWNAGQGRWNTKSLGATAPLNGAFYVETRVNVSNLGTDASPWQATIIARDSINWGGGAVVKPYPTTDTQLQGILAVSGNDIAISGNMGTSASDGAGAVLAHQQISFTGTLSIYGFVFAGSGTPTWTGDPCSTATSCENLSDTMSVGGNPTITYDCNTNCSNAACLIPMVRIKPGSWTEF